MGWRKAPGKSHREGVSLVEIMRMFPENETAAVVAVQ